ncbi:hypothetical protein EOM09_04795, partial [bacterium]|nr:hypothetical protein [bacterium]
MLSCCKKNLKSSDKILNFAETIAWEMEPYNNQIIPELNLKPNQTDLVFAAFFNPQRQRALSLIQLAEIYSCLKKPQKIYPIYLELVKLWKISLENPHKGKSFEVYLPGFIKLLFKENYKKEALYFTSLIPEIFPFYIQNDAIAKRQTLSYYQFKLKEYNKKGNFHKYRCLKGMAILINKEKGCELALQWIKKNTDNKNIKLKLFSDLSYIEKHKNNIIINEIKNLYPAYDKETITISSLKNLYIPILLNLYSLNKSKGDNFLLLVTNKIMHDFNEDSPVILMRLARSLKQVNYQESIKICNKSFNLIYSLPKNDPIERLKCINQLVKIIGKTTDQCFDKNALLNYLSETIENISIPGNKDRLYEIKIDSLLLIVDLMNYLEKKDETLKFLEQTNQYIQLLSNKDLKKSYKLVLFFKYADFEFFDEAFKISKQINFENYEKEYLINKISMLFIFNKINEKRWLFFDIDNNGKIDFINPEAD